MKLLCLKASAQDAIPPSNLWNWNVKPQTRGGGSPAIKLS